MIELITWFMINNLIIQKHNLVRLEVRLKKHSLNYLNWGKH